MQKKTWLPIKKNWERLVEYHMNFKLGISIRDVFAVRLNTKLISFLRDLFAVRQSTKLISFEANELLLK